jgi:hypothetical protein
MGDNDLSIILVIKLRWAIVIDLLSCFHVEVGDSERSIYYLPFRIDVGDNDLSIILLLDRSVFFLLDKGGLCLSIYYLLFTVEESDSDRSIIFLLE